MAIMKVVLIRENKTVVKIGANDAKSRKAVKKALVDIQGFSSLELDFEKSTLVAKGDVDPVVLVRKLKKYVSAELMMYGPEKDEGQPRQQQQQQQPR